MTKYIHILLLLLIIGNTDTYAQNTQTITPYWVQQDSIFLHLDKGYISTDVLYDRVYPSARIPSFTAQKDTVDYKYTMQVWHELYLASYNRSNLKDAATLRQKARLNTVQNKGITVGYIQYDYQHIAPYALDSGYLYIHPNDSTLRGYTILEDKAYVTKRIVLPIIAQNHISAGSQLFYFDSSMVMDNVNGNNQVQLKLSSGANVVFLNPGESKTLDIVPNQSGRPGIEVEIIFIPGITHTFPWYLFDISEPGLMSSLTTNECHSELEPIWSGSSHTFQGYDESIPTQGKGEYKIWYKMNSLAAGDCGDMRITKPVIVLDGFDPKNAIQEDPDYIWELLSYGDAGHLGDDLRVAGYDIIVLNFPEYEPLEHLGTLRDGGADYMERNAMVLAKLIETVNDSLVANGSTEEIVVIGPSMGGQIARYALKYMENQSIDHNTRLFIAFDSPNHGANIPIGVQAAIFYSATALNNEEALDKYTTKLTSVAARQLLIHQLGVQWDEEPIITNLEPFRNEWQMTIDTLGYPENVRKVALINGNQKGQYHNPESRMLTYHVEDVATGLINLGRLATLEINHLQESGAYVPFYFYQKMEDPYSYYYTNTTPYGNIDAAPGGTYDAALQIKNSLDLGHFIAMDSVILVDYFGFYTHAVPVVGDGRIVSYSGDRQCFIPTVSSLGYYDREFNWATIDFTSRNLVCEGAIPFDNYFTEVDAQFKEKVNADHVSITQQSAAWALEEILYGRPGCPTPCAIAISTTMPGTYMCGTDEYIFSIDVPFTAAEGSVEWTFSEGLVPVTGYISTNNNSIKLQWDGVNTPEERFVQARIIPKSGGTQCGAAKVLSLAVDYGEAFQLQLMPTRVTDPDFEMRVSSYHPTAYRYAWRDAATDPWPLSPTILYNRTFDKIPFDSTEVLSVRVYADGCPGYVSELSRTYIPIGLGWDEGDGPIRWQSPTIQVDVPTIAPNPTQDAWMLYLPQSWQATVQPLEITLVGPDGRTLHQTKTSTAKSQIIIPAAELASGVYIIRVQSGDKAYTLKAVKL